MQKKWLLLTTSVLLGTIISGCTMDKQGDLGNKNIRTNEVRYNAFGHVLRDKRFADDGMNERNRINGRRLNSNNLVGSHKNYRLEMNAAIADQITAIDAIQSSYVMLADNNAYVAVSLVTNEHMDNALSMRRSNLGLLGENSAAAGKRMGSLSTGEERLTEQLKMQVTDVVKQARPQTMHVYVSANADFVSRMSAYRNDFNNGYPIQNYIMEFNAMAERIFPVVKPDHTGDGVLKATTVRRKHRLLE